MYAFPEACKNTRKQHHRESWKNKKGIWELMSPTNWYRKNLVQNRILKKVIMKNSMACRKSNHQTPLL